MHYENAVQDIGIYVQPKRDLQWILIKVFKNVQRDPNRIDNKLEYLLDFLRKWNHRISSPQNFLIKLVLNGNKNGHDLFGINTQIYYINKQPLVQK